MQSLIAKEATFAERKAGLDFFPLTAVDEKENVWAGNWMCKNELNATKATLGVFANNPKAQAYYEAVGFKPFSKRIMKILTSVQDNFIVLTPPAANLRKA